MSEQQPVRQLPRSRPLADLPLAELLDRCGELARRWAAALVLESSLSRLGELQLGRLADEAPSLCEQTLRALSSEEELDRLIGAPGARPARVPAAHIASLSGASDVQALLAAVEALRRVLWEAIEQELRPSTHDAASLRRALDAGERLACVCALSLSAAIEAGEPEPQPPGQRIDPAGRAPREAATAAAAGAVIVDEALGDPAIGARRAARGAPAISIRDERRETRSPPWIAAVERQLARFERDGASFAVLLVDVRELEPPPGAATHARAGDSREIEWVLAAELREAAPPLPPGPAHAHPAAAPGTLTREDEHRVWLIAPGVDRAVAQRVAARVQRALERPARHGGGPLEATIGVAVCPDDGSQAQALAMHAELELYAVRARRGAGGSTRPASR